MADSIHRLAAETATMVTAIVTNLRDAAVNAERLAAMAESESSDGDRKTAQIKNNLSQMLIRLKTIDAEMETLLPRIDESGESLAVDIRDLISEIGIHHKVSSSIEAVEASLKKTVTKIKVKKVKSIVSDKSRLLEDLASQYTMNSERETLLSAAGIESSQLLPVTASIKNDDVPMPDAKTDAGNGEDLGDNVELF